MHCMFGLRREAHSALDLTDLHGTIRLHGDARPDGISGACEVPVANQDRSVRPAT